MARSNGSIAKGFRGRVGQVVFKQYAYGTVISQIPVMDHIKPSPGQVAQRTFFAEAVAYARSVTGTASQKAAYIRKHKLKKSQRPYNHAITEFRQKNKTRYNEILKEVLDGKGKYAKKK